jgi:hypothetical protein
MNFDQLIETVSEIINNDKINKVGMSIVYNLDPLNHKQLREELYYRTESFDTSTDIGQEMDYELEIEGITFKFIKNNN